MDLGFGPKLSRLAAGICFLLFVMALQYFFGRWVMLAVLFLPVLLWLLLRVTLPRSSRKKKVIDLVSNSVDIRSFFIERLDDHFESAIKRLRR
jgi:hypothetical protein